MKEDICIAFRLWKKAPKYYLYQKKLTCEIKFNCCGLLGFCQERGASQCCGKIGDNSTD